MKKTALLLICLMIMFSRAAWAEEDEAFLSDTWYDLSSIAQTEEGEAMMLVLPRS